MNKKKIWIFDERAGKFRAVDVGRCRKPPPPRDSDLIWFYWRKDKRYLTYWGWTHRQAWEQATKHLFNDIEKLKTDITSKEYLIKATYGPEPAKETK